MFRSRCTYFCLSFSFYFDYLPASFSSCARDLLYSVFRWFPLETQGFLMYVVRTYTLYIYILLFVMKNCFLRDTNKYEIIYNTSICVCIWSTCMMRWKSHARNRFRNLRTRGNTRGKIKNIHNTLNSTQLRRLYSAAYS